jgi:hypothetical protein
VVVVDVAADLLNTVTVDALANVLDATSARTIVGRNIRFDNNIIASVRISLK